jgi:aminoglycoside phosphotransferase (APT) family kinase protein
MSEKLSDNQAEAAFSSIEGTFAKIFTADISSSSGYGEVDVQTGNAPHSSWKAALESWRGRFYSTSDAIGINKLKDRAKNIGLAPYLADGFFAQFTENLPFASEVRRLYHGDPGFNNLIVHDNKVSAVIDWAQMGYGDWMRDFARLDFWWPDRHGNVENFAAKYNLDIEHLPERKALYWAVNALSTIEFADMDNNEHIARWLREHVANKRI